MLQVPLLVLALLYLLLESALLPFFLAAIAVSVEGLLHFLDQSRLKHSKEPIDCCFNIFDSSKQKVLVRNNFVFT